MNASLTPVDPRRIAALHEQGFSERWIARRLDLSAPTIRDRLREMRAETPLVQARAIFAPGDPPPGDDTPPGFNPANLRRCRGCGALVYLWPCLACCLADEAALAAPERKESRHDHS
jgi:hypothetical protein